MNKFIDAIKDCVNKFRSLMGKPVRIIGHLDADGIAASSILIQALRREGLKFAVSIVRQIDEELLDELKREDYEVIFFVDLGSGYLNLINKLKKKIFVLDHHQIEKVDNLNKDIIQLNPYLFGIDGTKDISGSGVVYLFCKELNEKNKDLAYLAVIGAIGDMQENNGFRGINNSILDDAVESKKIEVKRGLRMFGLQTRPLYKILQYSTDPFIPNVTGSEEGAKLFLKEIGIDIKAGGKYRKLIHLDDEEMKKLVTSIILKRLGSEKEPEDVLGNIYLLTEEKEEGSTKDAREFATLLNSCGRMGKASLGIGSCLSNDKLRKEAYSLLLEYKKELIEALNWFYKSKKKGDILEKEGFVIINAGDEIRDTLIGTVTSIVSKSNLYRKGTILIGMAYTLGNEIKVSVRCVDSCYLDLSLLVRKIVSRVGGLAGGHVSAAGAIIPQEREEDFIKQAMDILNKEVLNRKIIS